MGLDPMLAGEALPPKARDWQGLAEKQPAAPVGLRPGPGAMLDAAVETLLEEGRADLRQVAVRAGENKSPDLLLLRVEAGACGRRGRRHIGERITVVVVPS